MSTIEKAIDKLNRTRGSGESSADDSPNDSSLHTDDGGGAHDPRAAGDIPNHQGPGDNGAPPSEAVQWDIDQMESAGLLLENGGKNPLAEEYRQIKRPLLVNAFNKGAGAIENGNLIMVTSALPGEGKTFTAINLALSIALERDKTVLLVDADVARPAISEMVGHHAQQGLVDYLLHENMALSDVLLRTNFQNLRLLPAGRKHPHSTELLASENMHRLMQELATRYPDRIVIFDSPPLLPTTEAAVLAGLMGQVVMVVEAEKTPQEAIREALDLLDPEKMIGLVLNKSHRTFGTPYNDYYGYYAGKKK